MTKTEKSGKGNFKKVAGLVGIYALIYIVCSAMFIGLFHTGLLKGMEVLMYRGIVFIIIMGIIDADERIMRSGTFAPFIPMTTMSSSSIIFQMRIWAKAADYWAVKFDTTEKVYRELGKAGIEIPFQQMDVHIKSEK